MAPGEDIDSGMESLSSSNKSLATSGSKDTTGTTGTKESKESTGSKDSKDLGDLSLEKAGKSDIEDDEDIDDEDLDETLSERLWGLTEMFPEGVRNVTYTVLSGTSTGVKGLYGLSRVVTWYVFSSSVILFAPLIFEVERAQMEEVQRSQQKQVLLGPSSAMSGGMGLMPPVQR